MTRAIWFVALALTAPLAGCRAETRSAAASPARAPSGLEVIPVTIRGASGVHHFDAEVARTSAEQDRGLMYRTELARDRGMLFPFSPQRAASFWMKNTLIPLDLLFIRQDGTVARIAVNTIPQSLDSIAVAEPVAAVLEIPGGRSVELGIAEGDRVSWVGGPGR